MPPKDTIPRLLIRTEASTRVNVGTGHLWREIFLALAMRRKGVKVFFALSGSPSGRRLLKEYGFAYRFLPEGARGLKAFKGALRRALSQVVLFDRWRNDEKEIRLAQESGARVVLVDDTGVRGSLADVRINGLTENPLADYATTRYALIPPVRAKRRRYPSMAKTLVLCFGGHDHHFLMQKTLYQFARHNPFDKVWCFCDTAYRQNRAIKNLQKKLGRRVEFFFGDPRLPRYLAKADMGLLSGGLTLYQAMACGLPTIVLGQYTHQTQRARELAAKGIVVDGKALGKNLAALLNRVQGDKNLRRTLGLLSKKYVDGKGLSRVTRILWNLLKVDKMTPPSPLAGIIAPSPLAGEGWGEGPSPARRERGKKSSSFSFCPWDTDFFGVPTGQAYIALPTYAQAVEKISQEAKGKGIRCLYLFCDMPAETEVRGTSPGAGSECPHWLQEKDCKLVEIRCIYQTAVRALPKDQLGESALSVRAVRQEDLPPLRRIAWDFVPTSRFYRDGHFSTALCKDYYERYVDKEYRDNRKSFWVVEKDSTVGGFLSAQKESNDAGRIVLVAVAHWLRRQGAGVALIQRALQWAAQERLAALCVQTQQENRASCGLYEKTGFTLARQQRIYHRWL